MVHNKNVETGKNGGKINDYKIFNNTFYMNLI